MTENDKIFEQASAFYRALRLIQSNANCDAIAGETGLDARFGVGADVLERDGGGQRMKSFVYRPRTPRDVAVRMNQSYEKVDVAPAVEPEMLCTRCQHPRWAHCDVRRAIGKRTTLFVAKVRGGEYAWQRIVGPYNSRLSGYAPVRCRHASPDGMVNFPCCHSSACAVRECACASFQSPYRKKKAPKATAATGTGRKKKATAQIELFGGEERA
jgi:hypothetical protein